MNKVRERRKEGAVCPKCKSTDYVYDGRTYEPDGKHKFHCNSCGRSWQYGKSESVFTKLK